MDTPQWLLREVVVAIHEMLLAEFGGASGIRDEGLLDSALMRPQNLFAYENPTLERLAASYAYGLIKNHPFCDGNKRIAFTAAVLFLEINGERVIADEAEAVIQTLALAAGEQTEEAYADWLVKNLG